MKIEVIHKIKWSAPTQHQLKKTMGTIIQKLTQLKITAAVRKRLSSAKSLTLVFVGRAESQKLNKAFRQKNKPTDILSFAPVEAASLGELVLCVPIIKSDARTNAISIHEQLLYLLIHGVLHLLDYDHENNDKAAQKMYALQDQIFEDMR